MTDLSQWRNFDDYEDNVFEEVTNQKLYLILGVTGAVTIGFMVITYWICRKLGFPLVCRDLVLCCRRQISEFRAWITGDDIMPVFQAESIEMTATRDMRHATCEDTNDRSKSYSSIGLMRTYSWPLMLDNKSIAHNEASTSVSLA